jgi:hypothetical protein
VKRTKEKLIIVESFVIVVSFDICDLTY